MRGYGEGPLIQVPDHIQLDVHRDLTGRHRNVYGRRTVLLLLGTFLVLGLFNVFGQQPRTNVARGDVATLTVAAPTTLRSGLFYEGRFEVVARQRIDAAVIVLENGWLDDTSINTIAPAPAAERSVAHRLELEFGAVASGEVFTLHVQFQVNPTLGRVRSQDVELRDGDRILARVDRTVVTFP